jgi:hypothetical protein
VEVNKTGFCPEHFARLWDAARNRHPLSLVTHTHLKDIMSSAEKLEKHIAKSDGAGKSAERRIDRYIEYLREREASCMICDRMEYTLKRYAFTIVYLWDHKEDFAETFRASKGFCYHHLPGLLEMAREHLSRTKAGRFAADVARLERQSLDRLEGELLWYTQKFDYQNNDKPWGTSKDALHRALQKITGKIYRDR